MLINAIVYWNTFYLGSAFAQLSREGIATPPDLIKHITPLGWQHVSLTGDYAWTPADNLDLRPLRPETSILEARPTYVLKVGRIGHFRYRDAPVVLPGIRSLCVLSIARVGHILRAYKITPPVVQRDAIAAAEAGFSRHLRKVGIQIKIYSKIYL
ncbi:Tn3 family transposase [Rhizobium mongolense]|uniref:Tn3 transposase DDE domain-containing protein n=1 Tax=Rhizobium mongolense TaxID=57676 RepID=A0ABR6IZG1_9HYPH|nr:Tn3 family transposase [Rhizobium mongolense]MBB4233316.1 hypothetical protein [Rhizobium mongolense]